MLREGGVLAQLLEPCLAADASAANRMVLHLAVSDPQPSSARYPALPRWPEP